jgi:hypothetical protein
MIKQLYKLQKNKWNEQHALIQVGGYENLFVGNYYYVFT